MIIICPVCGYSTICLRSVQQSSIRKLAVVNNNYYFKQETGYFVILWLTLQCSQCASQRGLLNPRCLHSKRYLRCKDVWLRLITLSSNSNVLKYAAYWELDPHSPHLFLSIGCIADQLFPRYHFPQACCVCVHSVFHHIIQVFLYVQGCGFSWRGARGLQPPIFLLFLKKFTMQLSFRAEFLIQLEGGGVLVLRHNFFTPPHVDPLDPTLMTLFCLCVCSMTYCTNWYSLYGLHFFVFQRWKAAASEVDNSLEAQCADRILSSLCKWMWSLF